MAFMNGIASEPRSAMAGGVKPHSLQTIERRPPAGATILLPILLLLLLTTAYAPETGWIAGVILSLAAAGLGLKALARRVLMVLDERGAI